MLGAGVAFFALLALVPALVALLTLYGLAADPDEIGEQIVDALSATPAEVRDLIAQQVQDISEASSGAVIAVVGGLLLALWSASSGMKNLITAINRAYDEEETRSFVRLRGLSLGLTLGAILFFADRVPRHRGVAVAHRDLEPGHDGTCTRRDLTIRRAVRWAARRLGGAVPICPRPRRSQVVMGITRGDLRRRGLGARLAPVLLLYRELRHLQRDLRRPRRHRHRDAMAPAHRLGRHPRSRAELRAGTPNPSRHHHRSSPAASVPERPTPPTPSGPPPTIDADLHRMRRCRHPFRGQPNHLPVSTILPWWGVGTGCSASEGSGLAPMSSHVSTRQGSTSSHRLPRGSVAR